MDYNLLVTTSQLLYDFQLCTDVPMVHVVFLHMIPSQICIADFSMPGSRIAIVINFNSGTSAHLKVVHYTPFQKMEYNLG